MASADLIYIETDPVAGLTGSRTIAVPNTIPRSTTPPTTSAGMQTIPTSIAQTERLYTARSRAILKPTERGQYSYIKVLSVDPAASMTRHTSEVSGQVTSMGDTSGGVMRDAIQGNGYASFLLTGVRSSFDEKVQVTEVFGDAEVTYFFGRQPIQMDFSGMLIDSPDNDWFTQWIDMYAHVLRGSQLARNYEQVKLVLPNMTVIGTVIRTSWSQDSQRDTDIPFQFTMLVKQVIPAPVASINQPLTDNSVLNTGSVPSFTTQSQINSTKNSLNTLLGTIQNPFSTVSDLSSALSSVNSAASVVSTPFSDMATPTLGSSSSSSTFGSVSTFGQTAAASGAASTNIFATVSSNLTGVRASLFSPVYGVLTSLTKVVKAATGTASSVVSSFTSPVQNVLRDIRNISNQASSIVNMVNSNIKTATNDIRSVDSNLRSTLSSLKRTSGIISSSPKTVTQNLRELVNSGRMPTTRRFLQNRPGTQTNSASGSKITLLNSGAKHTPQAGAKL